jgi:hypothetical protein
VGCIVDNRRHQKQREAVLKLFLSESDRPIREIDAARGLLDKVPSSPGLSAAQQSASTLCANALIHRAFSIRQR